MKKLFSKCCCVWHCNDNGVLACMYLQSRREEDRVRGVIPLQCILNHFHFFYPRQCNTLPATLTTAALGFVDEIFAFYVHDSVTAGLDEPRHVFTYQCKVSHSRVKGDGGILLQLSEGTAAALRTALTATLTAAHIFGGSHTSASLLACQIVECVCVCVCIMHGLHYKFKV